MRWAEKRKVRNFNLQSAFFYGERFMHQKKQDGGSIIFEVPKSSERGAK